MSKIIRARELMMEAAAKRAEAQGLIDEAEDLLRSGIQDDAPRTIGAARAAGKGDNHRHYARGNQKVGAQSETDHARHRDEGWRCNGTESE